MDRKKQSDKPKVEEVKIDLDKKPEAESEDKAAVYLEMAQRLQAEFENFRRRSLEENLKAKESGQISVMEAFLPCLDTFKLAKKSIQDEKSLEGVEMIENKIMATLEKLGVEKIETIGKLYDPNLHEAITAVRVENKENNIILDEFQAGYKFNNKVIRYAKVIVNKKED